MVDTGGVRWSVGGGRRPFGLRHRLAGDPRLSVDAVAALAERLPPGAIETTTGALPLMYDGDDAPAVSGAAAALIAGMAAGRGWMAIKHIELDEAYRPLVDAALSAATAQLGVAGTTRSREGYIFVSSGQATTPAHVDHEHNLLLQVLGTKRVLVGTFPDAASEARVMEGMHSGSYGRTGFLPHHPTTFDLAPGTGVYIPPCGIHLVQCDAELSVSLSVVFHTVELERSARVYSCNARLRRLGLQPRPPQRSVAVDRLKSGAVLAAQRLRSPRHVP